MPVNLSVLQAADLRTPLPACALASPKAGVRKANRKDLTVFLLDEGTTVAGVFTQNRFCAAPVQVCREHWTVARRFAPWSSTPAMPTPAPAPTVWQRARATCDALAGRLGIVAGQVLPFSTGVIMEPLPVDRIVAGLPPPGRRPGRPLGTRPKAS